MRRVLTLPALALILIAAGVARADDALSQLQASEALALAAAQEKSLRGVREKSAVDFDGVVPAGRSGEVALPDSRRTTARLSPSSTSPKSHSKAIDAPIAEKNKASSDSLGKIVLASVLIGLIIAGAVAAGLAAGGLTGLAVGGVGLLVGRAIFKAVF